MQGAKAARAVLHCGAAAQIPASKVGSFVCRFSHGLSCISPRCARLQVAPSLTANAMNATPHASTRLHSTRKSEYVNQSPSNGCAITRSCEREDRAGVAQGSDELAGLTNREAVRRWQGAMAQVRAEKTDTAHLQQTVYQQAPRHANGG